MSTRSNKGIGFLLVEPLDLECVIHKSKRAVDTLQAAINSVEIRLSIDADHQVSIDTLQAEAINSVNQASNDTIQHVSKNNVHAGTVHGALFIRVLFTRSLFIPGLFTSTLFTRYRTTPLIWHRSKHYSLRHCLPKHYSPGHCLSQIDRHCSSRIDRHHSSRIDQYCSSRVGETVNHDTVHRGTVHQNNVQHYTVHPCTVHPTLKNNIHQGSTEKTCVETEEVNVIILRFDENWMLRDEEGHPRNTTGQLINAKCVVIPDVIVVVETTEFDLNRECMIGEVWTLSKVFFMKIPETISKNLRN
ncbi:Uncharacterized protein Rs2_15790 [Raphanus sativus]|uniref:Uncharacterized protein LOC130511305 n=1 Tax=Raphanus sativus TaxID=3726 RepID=A0A9W3DK96_RAPSA|nr:uncharacterized protein LOC130511305 [Raphanus sativus]XP_056864206.1 uncharacterized protein LOC130511305 [Raphanus sativus]KAJ4901839.1 Uncharacterized protein Rs2_15790 [Raphanus sativus]